MALLLLACLPAVACGEPAPTQGVPSEDAGVTDGESPSVDAAKEAQASGDAAVDAPVAAWVSLGSLGRDFDDSIYSVSAVADLDRPDRLFVVGTGKKPGATMGDLRAILFDGGRVAVSGSLAAADGLETLAFGAGPLALSHPQLSGEAIFALHDLDGAAWRSRSLGSGQHRPPQAAFGGWPPRSIVANHTRLFLVTGSELRDATDVDARTWPDYLFNSGQAGSPTSAFDAAARDPGSDDRVILFSRLFGTIRTCTLGATLSCTPDVTVAGLPAAYTQVDGFWPLGSEVYLSIRTPAGNAELYASHDAGATFSLAQAPFAGGRFATTHAAHPSQFAWLDDNAVHFSADAGRSWRVIPLPVLRRGLASGIALHAGASLYLFEEGNAYRYATP
ncbi:MAG: hypothetical protein HOO96_43170 [Polyangiaceae bacterium]|nr:hypothetical protein [Polyangiaceae bacterium]